MTITPGDMFQLVIILCGCGIGVGIFGAVAWYIKYDHDKRTGTGDYE